MATLESIAIRRAAALERADLAMQRITQTLTLDIEAFPAPHRELEMRPALEAEWLAGTLEAVADTLDPKAEALADALEDKTRTELDAYATDLGVADPDKLPNKAAVIAAIQQVEADTAPEQTDTSDATKEGPDMNVPNVPNPEDQPEPQPVDTDGGDTTDDVE
jgi:uncharacterized membrane protein YccC